MFASVRRLHISLSLHFKLACSKFLPYQPESKAHPWSLSQSESPAGFTIPPRQKVQSMPETMSEQDESLRWLLAKFNSAKLWQSFRSAPACSTVNVSPDPTSEAFALLAPSAFPPLPIFLFSHCNVRLSRVLQEAFLLSRLWYAA